MYHLNDQQIDYIFNDIGARGVEMESLQQNLLDHICCIIEHDLEENGDFESFYQKTIKTFYKDALWEIEEETILLLTYKNYYTMKKIMITSGIVSAAAMICGILFKFMHWPGASLLIIFGIGTSSLIFLPLFFLLKARDRQQTKDKVILALATVSGILMSMHILFRVMHWPGSLTLGIIGIIILVTLFLPLYFFNGIKNPDNKINTITSTVIIIMACGLWLTLINARPGQSIENISIHQNKHLADCYEYATHQNDLIYHNLLSDSTPGKKNLAELKEKSDALCKQIEDLKMKIFRETEQTTATKIDYEQIHNPANYDIPTRIAYSFEMLESPNPVIITLTHSIEDYNVFINKAFKQNSAALLDLSDKKLPGNEVPMTWAMRNFYHVPFICVLRNLTQLQVEIRLIESNCMR